MNDLDTRRRARPRQAAAADPVDAAADVVEDLTIRGCLDRSAGEREALARRLYEWVHPFMAALGVLFLLVVLAQRAAAPGTALNATLIMAGWLLWAAFVAEYAMRLAIAPDRLAFLRSTWWQVLFLCVPFLSMVRALLFLRLARPTRVVFAAIRGTRSASATLQGRIAWLATLTAIVALSSADLLYGAGAIRPYGAALQSAALATINGQRIDSDHGLAQVLNVALAVYAVVVFATLAGMIGAFLLERRGSR